MTMYRQLNRLAQARVLVVGDLILDRYWHGKTRRISPEAPVPVVLVSEVVERVGGAANVAANAAAVGGKVALIGVVGDDEAGATLTSLCAAAGIEREFLVVPGQSTVVKLRVVSQRQQLVRVDFEQETLSAPVADLVAAVERQLQWCQVVVISDYAKGAVGRVKEIIQRAKAAHRHVIVDPKGVDFSRYAGATVITPNLQEFEAVVGRCADDEDVASKGHRLARELDFGAVLITRGAAGMTLVQADASVLHVSAHAQDVFDVTGAGDTVCGVLAAALATDGDLSNAVVIANSAASVAVGKFGTATVTASEIEAAMASHAGVRQGIVTRGELLLECDNAQRRGERVVMTNGCFDVLHAGHVRFLREAKALGNRLIVAVNDDASVTGLKGAGRPLNALAARMEVLEGLDAVDWVVPFSGETPRHLIAEVSPDVLVKGGDYDVEEIAGGHEVRAAGGEVVVLEYHDGQSSTRLIELMKGQSESAL